MPVHLPVVHAHEEVVDHEDETGAVWRRVGSCSGCGACCKGDPFGGTLGTPVVEGACAMYREGVGCSDKSEANPYYASACAKWPTHPHQTADKPDCSYRFERVR